MKLNRFATYAWFVLAYNIIVVLWGDFVRATGSGAGCGQHWPSCQGDALPQATQTDTIIEFAHRLTSGLALVFVIGLLVWAYRAYPKNHTVRLGATLSMVFIILEALVGAGLVLFGWVAGDTSPIRAGAVSVHLVNTFILLSVLTLTAWWGSGGKPLRLKGQGWLSWVLGFSFICLLILGASGAMTALSDTLFPADTLAEGLQQKFSPSAHFLVRLRLYHPLIAIAVGIYFMVIAGLFNASRPTPNTRRIARIFTAIYLVQLTLGALNVVLLTPIWIQQLHLFLTDLILIVWVLFAAAALAQEGSHSVSSEASQTSQPSRKEMYGSLR